MPIVKISQSSDFAASVDYVLGNGGDDSLQELIAALPATDAETFVPGFTVGKRARVMDTNLAGLTAKKYTRQFRKIAAQRFDISKPAITVTVSLKPGEHLEAQQWVAVINDLQKELGYEDSPFLLVQHREKAHEHAHVIFSRIGFEGKVVNNSFERLKTRKWAQKIEAEYDLTPTAFRATEKGLTRSEKERAQRDGTYPPRHELKEIINQLLTDKLNDEIAVGEFALALEKQNVSVRLNYDKGNNEPNGISFKYKNRARAGGKLGADYSWQGLQKKGLSYEAERDAENLAEASRRAVAKQLTIDDKTLLADNDNFDEIWAKPVPQTVQPTCLNETVSETAAHSIELVEDEQIIKTNIETVKISCPQVEQEGAAKSEIKTPSLELAESAGQLKSSKNELNVFPVLESQISNDEETVEAAAITLRSNLLQKPTGPNQIDERQAANSLSVGTTESDQAQSKVTPVIVETEKRDEMNAASHSALVAERQIKQPTLREIYARQLGIQMLFDAAVKEAEAELSEFEKTKSGKVHDLTVKIDGREEKRRTSLAELERERRAFAVTEIENDRETGVLQMIADNQNRSVEAIEKSQYLKAIKKAEQHQIPWLKAVADEQALMAQKLAEDFNQIRIRRNLVQKNTDAFAQQYGENHKPPPLLAPEQIWDEQIRAAERNDAKTFGEFEKFNRANKMPRPNHVYARLRGLELMTELNARLENKRSDDALSSFGKDEKRIVAVLKSDENGNLSVIKLNVINVHNENQQSPTDAHDEAAESDKSENGRAAHAARQTVNLLLNSSFSTNGKIVRLTNPAKAFSALMTPTEILRNDPGRRIICAVSDYLKGIDNPQLLESIAAAPSDLTASAPSFSGQTKENAISQTATAVREAVTEEEILRANLSLTAASNEDLLIKPNRSFSDWEIKTIGGTVEQLGDADLLKTIHEAIDLDANLANLIYQTPGDIAARTLLSEARAADASRSTIETVSLTKSGAIEVTINPARLETADKMIETAQAAQDFQIRINVEGALPRLSLGRIAEAEGIFAALGNQAEMREFINQQYAVAGTEMLRAMQERQTISANEQFLLEKMSLPSETMQRFAQIEQSNQAADLLHKQGETAAQMNAQFQNVGQTLTTTNPHELREREASDFWARDRAQREQQIAQEKAAVSKTQTAAEALISRAMDIHDAETAEGTEETRRNARTLS